MQLFEVLAWKLWGAIAWHAALCSWCSALWYFASMPGSSYAGQLFHFSTLFRLLGSYVTAVLVLYTQRRLLSTTDVPPLYVARLGLSGKSWISLFITRCLKRNGNLSDLLDVVAFYGSCVLSGIWTCRSLVLRESGTGGYDAKVPIVYGTTLGLLYAVVYLIRAKNNLSYPIIHRHRYYRIKKRLRSVARSAIVQSSMTLLLCLLGTSLHHLYETFTTSSSSSIGAAFSSSSDGLLSSSSSSSLKSWLAAWRAGLLLVGVWSLGAHVLEVVFTEPVAMAEEGEVGGRGAAANSTGALIAALRHKDPLLQDWALQDLATVARGGAGAAARRAAIFADDTGTLGWSPLTSYSLVEVNDFIAVMAAAQASAGGTATAGGKGGGGGGSRVKWNVLQVSASGTKAVNREQDVAAWQMRSRYYRMVWSLGALSDLAAASLTEDTYGVAMLSTPHLADLLLSLLGTVAVLQAYCKQLSATPQRAPSALVRRLQQLGLGGDNGSSSSVSGEGLQHVDAAAWALLDTAKAAVYKVTHTFGPALGPMLRRAGRKPPAGSLLEPLELLDSFLQQEQ